MMSRLNPISYEREGVLDYLRRKNEGRMNNNFMAKNNFDVEKEITALDVPNLLKKAIRRQLKQKNITIKNKTEFTKFIDEFINQPCEVK